MPTLSRRNTASSSSLMVPRSCPATSTRPLVARSRPASTIIIVDLPEPDGPTTATVSPRRIVRLTPRRMLTSPAWLSNFRWTSANVTNGRSFSPAAWRLDLLEAFSNIDAPCETLRDRQRRSWKVTSAASGVGKTTNRIWPDVPCFQLWLGAGDHAHRTSTRPRGGASSTADSRRQPDRRLRSAERGVVSGSLAGSLGEGRHRRRGHQRRGLRGHHRRRPRAAGLGAGGPAYPCARRPRG